jgi:hypothetical protein
MDPGFARDAREIVDEALGGLSKAPAARGRPQYFFVVSRRTKFMVNVTLSAAPSLNLDDIFLAIYDFLDSQTVLEDGNIYLSKLQADSVLLEPLGGAVFAEAFAGDVDRSRYKEFHRAVRHFQKCHPALSSWDGAADGLPTGFRDDLKAFFQPGAAAAPAAPERPAPARESARPKGPEPDIQDCERKMREWYKSGLKIDRLKDALHKDWATIVRTFDSYERNVARLNGLRARLGELRGMGFDEELDRLGQLLNDPGNVREMERQFSEQARRIKDRYTIKLPVTDRRQLAEAVRSLPLGIPSSLWGIPLETLLGEFLSAERGVGPEGSVVVFLRGQWYLSDPASPGFLGPFEGLVRTQKEMLPPGVKLDRLDELIATPADDGEEDG